MLTVIRHHFQDAPPPPHDIRKLLHASLVTNRLLLRVAAQLSPPPLSPPLTTRRSSLLLTWCTTHRPNPQSCLLAHRWHWLLAPHTGCCRRPHHTPRHTGCTLLPSRPLCLKWWCRWGRSCRGLWCCWCRRHRCRCLQGTGTERDDDSNRSSSTSFRCSVRVWGAHTPTSCLPEGPAAQCRRIDKSPRLRTTCVSLISVCIVTTAGSSASCSSYPPTGHSVIAPLWKP